MISAPLGSSLGWDIAAWASRRFPPGGLCAAIVGFHGLLSLGPLRGAVAALSVRPRGVGIAAWAPGGPRALLSVGLCGVVPSLKALGSSPEGRPKFASRAPFSLPPFSLLRVATPPLFPPPAFSSGCFFLFCLRASLCSLYLVIHRCDIPLPHNADAEVRHNAEFRSVSVLMNCCVP